MSKVGKGTRSIDITKKISFLQCGDQRRKKLMGWLRRIEVGGFGCGVRVWNLWNGFGCQVDLRTLPKEASLLIIFFFSQIFR